MVLGGGASGRWSGHVGGALMKGISALTEGAPESSLPLLPCEDTARRRHLWTRRRVLTRHQGPYVGPLPALPHSPSGRLPRPRADPPHGGLGCPPGPALFTRVVSSHSRRRPESADGRGSRRVTRTWAVFGIPPLLGGGRVPAPSAAHGMSPSLTQNRIKTSLSSAWDVL